MGTVKITNDLKVFMHYHQQNGHRIEADLALRIGKIARQYDTINLSVEQKFTDTLHLCLLQNLLTNCSELLNAMDREDGELLGLRSPLSAKADWGLDAVEIRTWDFDEEYDLATFLKHLRNAMSHPTGTDPDARFPSSGYNSLPNEAGMIEAVVFCDSPDIKNKRPKTWPTKDLAEKECRSRLPGVSISLDRQNRYGLFCDGDIYARVFLVVLTTDQLRSLVLGLANLLAQPTIENWDGRQVIDLIAA
jgi:hypothetical protein